MPARIGPKRPFRVFLKEWREYDGLTQPTVGERFDPPVSKGQVSKWEKMASGGRIGAETVAAYADALGRRREQMFRPPPPKGQSLPKTLDDVAEEMGVRHDDVVTAIEIMARKRAS
jgi:transcriptional regulator with XRE-family HTH domain